MVAVVAVGDAYDHQEEQPHGDAQWPPVARHGHIGCHGGPAVILVFRFQGVLGHHTVFVQAEKMCGGADETPIEGSARQLVPLAILQRFQKARADARGGGNFLKRYPAHLTFAF